MKAEAVHLVAVEGQSIRDVCEVMGVGQTALRRWVTQWQTEQDRPLPSPAETAADKAQLAVLLARVDKLEQERDRLKKSIAFFLQENDRASK